MCQDCGCSVNGADVHVHHSHQTVRLAADGASIEVLHNILGRNEHDAAHNRAHFAAAGTFAVNLMSAPGSGKTSLLEATIERLKDRYRIAVIEGDLETENDAARIRAKGVPAVQITTGQTCHLDAAMVHEALHGFGAAPIDLLFIENVGNLVCPAVFDLGQTANAVLLATTEGEDKPAKYPVMFRAADLVLISKCDLLPVLDDFSVAAATRHLRALANAAPVLEISARKLDTLDGWIHWLEHGVMQAREHAALGDATHRHHRHHAAE